MATRPDLALNVPSRQIRRPPWLTRRLGPAFHYAPRSPPYTLRLRPCACEQARRDGRGDKFPSNDIHSSLPSGFGQG